jgi:hypothetical protein
MKPMSDKLYTFRKLNSTDLFPMVKIISKIGLDELTQVFEGDILNSIVGRVENEHSDKKQIEFLAGMNVVAKIANKILEHLPKCEKEIYSLLANVSGMTTVEVKSLDLDVFMEMILDFVMKEEFKSFFKVASKYITA